MILFYVFCLFCICGREGQAIKCMQDTDARYVTAGTEFDQDWLGKGWHSGIYMPDPVEVDVQEETHKNFLLAQEQNAARIWWKKIKDSDYYLLLTNNSGHLLCTVENSGLQIGWLSTNSDLEVNPYCQWEVTLHSEDQEKFKIRNRQLLESIPSIQSVYWAISGVYFKYNESEHNYPDYVVPDHQKWWRWMKSSPDQREINDLFDNCADDPEQEELLVQSRSGGGGTISRFTYRDDFVQCTGPWYLFNGVCYRLFTAPQVTYRIAKTVCEIFQSEMAIPSDQATTQYLVSLVKSFDKRGRLKFWIGARSNSTRVSKDDFKSNAGGTITFKNWSRKARRMSLRSRYDYCAEFFQGRWNKKPCHAASNVMCQKAPKSIGDRGNCGKLADEGIDEYMATLDEPVKVTKKKTDLKERIVGGQEAVPGQFPWQVAIRFKYGKRFDGHAELVYHNCGGTLIDKCWVLSAAHCFTDRDPATYEIRLGDMMKSTFETNEQRFDVQRIIIHEQYREVPSARNDIALIKLQPRLGKCATLTETVQAACLPSKDWEPKVKRGKCHVSGWGVTNTSIGQESASEQLMFTSLPIMSNKICKRRYNSRKQLFLDTVMICAGLKHGGEDACSGDSGGPFVCRGQDGKYALTGIVSFGIGCARQKYPGVYTNVVKFLDWITTKLEANGGGDIIVI